MRQSRVFNLQILRQIEKMYLKKVEQNIKCQVIIYTTQDDEINQVRNMFANFINYEVSRDWNNSNLTIVKQDGLVWLKRHFWTF